MTKPLEPACRFVAHRIVTIRLFIALAQGGALWFLHHVNRANLWPAPNAELFTPLLATALFVPSVALVGIGNLRPRTLMLWIAAAAVLCAGLGFHSGSREVPIPSGYNSTAVWPDFYFALTGLFFVGQALITVADIDRKWIARFPTYFDVAWKHTTQLALACLFIGLLWGMLALGAELFRLIKIEVFAAIIARNWFWIPATTLAASAALHLTDGQTVMVRSARTLLLGLLSWLMPIMVLIGAAFLAALPFTGLEPLWNTRRATASLLSAAIILILLINSHFQGGGSESKRFRTLVYARLAAALMLTPLVALSAIGLGLRIEQHGWTPSRIIVLACLIAAGFHAIGYAVAAIRSGTALRELAATNVLGAFAMVAILIALLTPIADPARLAVADQVSRLAAGTIGPDKFDYRLLRFHGAGYGWAALELLKNEHGGPSAAQIAIRAAEALDRTYPKEPPSDPNEPALPPQPATPATRAENITVVHPAGQRLPESFIRQAWHAEPSALWMPPCLATATRKCLAILLDIDNDGASEVILLDDGFGGRAIVFQKSTDGS